MNTFYVGLHQPHDAHRFENAFISINRLRKSQGAGKPAVERKSDFPAHNWILDSGAFTLLNKFGYYPEEHSTANYAQRIARWSSVGNLVAACAQDYMCEPFMFDGQFEDQAAFDEWNDDYLDDDERDAFAHICPTVEDDYKPIGVADHQRLTVDRFTRLQAEVKALGCDTPVLPVLQGYEPQEYVDCIRLYEAAGHLPKGAYVGVGSVCKRNGDPKAALAVLKAIKSARPDLRIHGFGLKITALENAEIRALLETSDSMAWSKAARNEGRDGNDWKEAKAYENRVREIIGQQAPLVQGELFAA